MIRFGLDGVCCESRKQKDTFFTDWFKSTGTQHCWITGENKLRFM